ncbi:MAG: winged helix-turn-helix domain-containing protein [Acidobacteria bacterium]|nr:winged helix-turn-helix domain-containing protein [Acidobacteriota bacterium]
MLAILLEHAGQVVTREELRRHLWPEAVFGAFENDLNTVMAPLRAYSANRESTPASSKRYLNAATGSSAICPAERRPRLEAVDTSVR